jgi:hypothetical protein
MTQQIAKVVPEKVLEAAHLGWDDDHFVPTREMWAAAAANRARADGAPVCQVTVHVDDLERATPDVNYLCTEVTQTPNTTLGAYMIQENMIGTAAIIARAREAAPVAGQMQQTPEVQA